MNYVDRLKKIRKEQWYLLLLIGICLAVVTMPAKEVGTFQIKTQERETRNTVQVLEEKLEGMLTNMEGVGDVQVMISERKEEEPYRMRKENSPQINGMLVLAQGGENAVVQKEITEAVQALFGLEAHKIKVVKMMERRE